MKLLVLVPVVLSATVGTVMTGLAAVQVGATSEPTLGMQWLNTGLTSLVLLIGAALITAFLKFREATLQRAEEDREKAAALVATAKADAERDIAEAKVDADHKVDVLRAAMQGMHGQNQELLQGIAKSVGDMSTVIFGARGFRGMTEEMEHASAARHSTTDHIAAIEGHLHVLGKFLAQKLGQDCPEFIAPPAIDRRRPRDHRHE